MSLALALNTALAGININSLALSVLSQNIANVNTPGYSRKIVNQEAQSIGGVGVGVRIADINRRVDQYLIQAMRLQNSAVGKAKIINEYADRTQLMFGNPGSSNSINSYITTFFNTLQSLSQTPEDATLRAGAIQSAQTLSNQISQLAQGLQDIRYQADQDVYAAVQTINTDLKQIDLLNKAIAQNFVLGRPATELLDQRDKLLSDLAQYLDIQTFTREDGTVTVSTNGVSLVDETLFQLSYSPATSTTTFINDGSLSSIKIYRSNENGDLLGSPMTLTTAGTSSQVASVFTTGSLKGLFDIRDRQVPKLLDQLDQLTFQFKDQINASHNAGSGFPGAASYTGSYAFSASDATTWNGSMRIAVLGNNGHPISSYYSNLPGGLPPLTIDLSTLDSGTGAGRPDLQTIIDEINQYYGSPQNRVQLGSLTNIRLASDSTRLPGTPPAFSFDLDLENISSLSANVFVTGIQVLDDTNADISSITQNVPSVALAPSNSFVTTSGSNVITVNTASAHGLTNGQKIFLPDITTAILPATDVNGIPLTELNDQFFTVSNVTATSFSITATTNATASSGVNSTGATVLPPYSQVDAGESGRTTDDGIITASLAGNSSSSFYTFNVDVAVEDENGNINTSTITYRVDNNQNNLLNDRYSARSATGNGTIIAPASNQPYARALMVDADGNELPTLNGRYITSNQGYLKIQANGGSNVIAIDSLNSSDQGDINVSPPVDATHRGFSYYFGLNNFFVDNNLSDPLTNSALNLEVEQRLIDNPNLVSTGRLTLIPTVPGQAPTYTYERNVGDQSNILEMVELGFSNVSFDAAGGLGSASQTFSGYASQIIGIAATNATTNKSTLDSAELLMSGFSQRGNAIAGVNLDEELANTVIYQNAYTASARIITVLKDLFDTLLQAV